MRTLFLLLVVLAPFFAFSQNKETVLPPDSSKAGKPASMEADRPSTLVADKPVAMATDTTVKAKAVREYDPRVATRRSAIIPGWGQAYNRKYWKIPIVYGALGTCAGIFVYNLNWYKRTRYAYGAVLDPANFPPDQVHPDLKFLVDRNDSQTLGYLRDSYRRDVDYSALIFVILWGLNVVDAAVDAHLKSFDVSPDLSFKFKPGYSEMAGTNGLSLVFSIGKRPTASLPSRF